MATLTTDGRVRDGGPWLGHGAMAGLAGGLVFMAFEMVAAALTMGVTAALLPLRMIGAMLLGRGALEPSWPVIPVVVAGLFVHAMLSAAFGLVFAALLRPEPGRRRDQGAWPMLVTASAYGFALWLVNFYVIAPIAGWEWFPQQTNPVIQFVAHTFFFGTVVGVYLDRVQSRGRGLVLERRGRRRAA